MLVSYPLEAPNPAAGLRDGLHELGYVEGRNIAFEWRSARGDSAQYPRLAADLARLNVDVIVAGANPAIRAAASATKTIPIVMGIAVDPVAARFVASLSRPGGNITGVSIQSNELAAKRLQLLKEAFPKVSRVAILWEPEPGRSESKRAHEQAALAMGMQVQVMEIRTPSDLDGAFKEIEKHRIGAVVLTGSTLQFAQRARIADLALKNRLPVMASTRSYAQAGLLLSYGADFKDGYRRAAPYVDKILKGVNPGSLPVEQPTKFELVINGKAAKALGLAIPKELLLRADEVIE